MKKIFLLPIIVVLSLCSSCGSDNSYLGFWQDAESNIFEITETSLIIGADILPLEKFSEDFSFDSYPKSEYTYIGDLIDECDYHAGSLLYNRAQNVVVYLGGAAYSLWENGEKFYPIKKLSSSQKKSIAEAEKQKAKEEKQQAKDFKKSKWLLGTWVTWVEDDGDYFKYFKIDKNAKILTYTVANDFHLVSDIREYSINEYRESYISFDMDAFFTVDRVNKTLYLYNDNELRHIDKNGSEFKRFYKKAKKYKEEWEREQEVKRRAEVEREAQRQAKLKAEREIQEIERIVTGYVFTYEERSATSPYSSAMDIRFDRNHKGVSVLYDALMGTPTNLRYSENFTWSVIEKNSIKCIETKSSDGDRNIYTVRGHNLENGGLTYVRHSR